MMEVAAVGQLDETTWHYPDLTDSYAGFEVRLMTHNAMGATDKDFEPAHKTEETIG